MLCFHYYLHALKGSLEHTLGALFISSKHQLNLRGRHGYRLKPLWGPSFADIHTVHIFPVSPPEGQYLQFKKWALVCFCFHGWRFPLKMTLCPLFSRGRSGRVEQKSCYCTLEIRGLEKAGAGMNGHFMPLLFWFQKNNTHPLSVNLN